MEMTKIFEKGSSKWAENQSIWSPQPFPSFLLQTLPEPNFYMKKNPTEIFTTIETDPNTGEYYTIIPEWIINDMNWYEGTELRFNIDTEEVIITEKDD